MTQFPAPSALLPHKGEMIFIDQILSHDDKCTTCSFTWKKNSSFSDASGRLPQALLIEVAAQAVGLHAGLRQAREKITPKIGFLIAINQITLPIEPLPAAVEHTIHVDQSWDDPHFGIFNVKITEVDNNQCFSGQLKLLQPNTTGI